MFRNFCGTNRIKANKEYIYIYAYIIMYPDNDISRALQHASRIDYWYVYTCIYTYIYMCICIGVMHHRRWGSLGVFCMRFFVLQIFHEIRTSVILFFKKSNKYIQEKEYKLNDNIKFYDFKNIIFFMWYCCKKTFTLLGYKP